MKAIKIFNVNDVDVESTTKLVNNILDMMDNDYEQQLILNDVATNRNSLFILTNSVTDQLYFDVNPDLFAANAVDAYTAEAKYVLRNKDKYETAYDHFYNGELANRLENLEDVDLLYARAKGNLDAIAAGITYSEYRRLYEWFAKHHDNVRADELEEYCKKKSITMTMKIKKTIYGDKDKKTTIVRDLDAEIAEAGVTIPDNFYLDVVYNLIAPISGKNSKSRKNLLQGICKNRPFWACKWDTMWVNKDYGNVEPDYELKLAWATYIAGLVNCSEENADNVYRDFNRSINDAATHFYYAPLRVLEYAMRQIGKENKQDDLISKLKVGVVEANKKDQLKGENKMTTMTEKIEQVRNETKTTEYTEPMRLWLYHQFDVFNDAEAVDELVSAYSPDWIHADDTVVWQVIDGRGNVEVMSDEDFKRRSILHALNQNKKRHLGYREAGLYCYIDAVMYDRMNNYKHYSMKEDN